MSLPTVVGIDGSLPAPAGARIEGPFTVHPDRRIDARVTSDLERICRAILTTGVPCEAIVLAGSFGRGEGSVVSTEGGPMPYNDYDIVVVSGDPGARDAFGRLKEPLARALGFDHLDVLLYDRGDLARRPVSQQLYDLRHGGRVIHGDPDVLEEIPDRGPAEIPLESARMLLINRLTCPLEGVREEWLSRPPAGPDLLRMEYMAHKVVLCCAQALLLMEGEYEPTDERRAERFARRFAHRVDAVGLVREATRFKLRDTRAQSPDPSALWFGARDLYLDTIRECMPRALGRPLASWADLAGVHEGGLLTHWLRRLRWWLVDGRRHADVVAYRRKARLEMAELYLVAAPSRGGDIDGVWLERARRRLRAHHPGPLDSWEDARAAAITCDRRYVHPVAR